VVRFVVVAEVTETDHDIHIAGIAAINGLAYPDGRGGLQYRTSRHCDLLELIRCAGQAGQRRCCTDGIATTGRSCEQPDSCQSQCARCRSRTHRDTGRQPQAAAWVIEVEVDLDEVLSRPAGRKCDILGFDQEAHLVGEELHTAARIAGGGGTDYTWHEGSVCLDDESMKDQASLIIDPTTLLIVMAEAATSERQRRFKTPGPVAWM